MKFGGLLRKSVAPNSKACRFVSAVDAALKTITGRYLEADSARSCCRISIPVTPGITMSSSRMSGVSRRINSIACVGSVVVMKSAYPAIFRYLRTNLTSINSSSTIMILDVPRLAATDGTTGSASALGATTASGRATIGSACVISDNSTVCISWRSRASCRRSVPKSYQRASRRRFSRRIHIRLVAFRP